MSTAARRKGSKFEADLVKWFRQEATLPAERLHLAGREDEGDVAVQDVGLTYLIEAKAETRMTFSSYVAEAKIEALHYAKARGLNPLDVLPLAVVKRPGLAIGESYVVTTLDEFFKQN